MKFVHTYNDIICVENLLGAWKEFLNGKRKRKDVQEFQLHLMDNILSLHQDLKNKTYKHGRYEAFNISDPKPRNIHKASVRDRLFHHAIYRQLYPYFDNTFIADSYSCRNNKGTHRAIDRLRSFVNKVSKNNTKTVWVFKSDIRKFFASIGHSILMNILKKHISDKDIISLLEEIVGSFSSGEKRKGLPLGNLTSQLFVNVYMNELDKFVKHKLKAKYYIRYADDFVILSRDRQELLEIHRCIGAFLKEELQLKLHKRKTSIETFSSGVDFLGWVHFPTHRVLRSVTKRRMLKRISEVDGKQWTLQSYLGLLGHGDAYELKEYTRSLSTHLNK